MGVVLTINCYLLLHFKIYKREFRLLGPLRTGTKQAELTCNNLPNPSTISSTEDVQCTLVEWMDILLVNCDLQMVLMLSLHI